MDRPLAKTSKPRTTRQPPAQGFQIRPARKSTYMSGKLVYGNDQSTTAGAFTIDCAIRDISEGGARVSLSRLQPLPLDLFLIVIKYGIAYRARIVWQKFPARGLKFLTPYFLDGAMPADLSFLRKLWVDLAAREGGDTLPIGYRPGIAGGSRT
jgi:PilZ domain-containing protein